MPCQVLYRASTGQPCPAESACRRSAPGISPRLSSCLVLFSTAFKGVIQAMSLYGSVRTDRFGRSSLSQVRSARELRALTVCASRTPTVVVRALSSCRRFGCVLRWQLRARPQRPRDSTLTLKPQRLRLGSRRFRRWQSPRYVSVPGVPEDAACRRHWKSNLPQGTPADAQDFIRLL